MNQAKKFLKTLPKLSKEAQKEWDRIIEVLGEETINECDFSLLYEYSKTFADVIRLEEIVEREGEVISGASGAPYGNPRFYALNSRRETLGKLRRDLNFTPKARQEKGNSNKGGELEDLTR